MSEPTDNEVMRRVKSGRTGDMAILFERHHGQLSGYFQRMTGSRSTAEDLVQEAFIRMLRYRRSFRGDGGGFTTWMFSLARHLCRDHLRREVRHRHLELAEVQEPPGEDRPAVEEMERNESLTRLRRALLLLHEDRREVLVLRRFHLRSFQEIAQVLGCTEGAARVRAYRALRELKAIYERLAGKAKP